MSRDDQHQSPVPSQGPPGRPFEDSDFELVQTSIPVPGDGEFLVKVTHLSIDPVMRSWMNAGHATPVDVGAVMRAITIGQVVHSRHPGFAEGDFVHGTFGVQEFALSDGTKVYKVHPEEGRSLAAYLGVLGMTGMTAYFGLLDVGRLASDDVALVSGAAGAVGSVAGQIAKIKGAHVIGIAGGPEKTRMLVDRLGFSVAIDYKRDDFPDQLRDLTPDTSTCSSTTSAETSSTRHSPASPTVGESSSAGRSPSPTRRIRSWARATI